MLTVAGLATILACGGRRTPEAEIPSGPAAVRVVPLAEVFILETAGPPPPDTSVTFTTGSERTIVLHHGGETIPFARLSFERAAFGDSGQTVQVEVQPRPGVYGLDFTTSLPFRSGLAKVTFVYGRYFSAPARGRQVYGSDAGFERAMAIGRLLPNGRIELLPSTHPAGDNLQTILGAAGTYLVAAPQ